MGMTKEQFKVWQLNKDKAKRDEETRRIKSDINLRDFAVVHCGFQIDKKGSTASEFVLRRDRNNAIQSSGDKITVSQKAGEWIFYDHRSKFGGSIIEFAAAHYSPCAGQDNPAAIRELKKFLGIQIQSQSPSINSGNSKPVESVKITTAEAAQAWKTFAPVAPDNEYLTQARQLSPDTVAAFSEAMATNQAGEICFPLREILKEEDGQVRVGNLRGWIRKNTRNPSQDGNICKGGTRGIWIHRPSPPEKGSKIQTRTILFEAPIDAMSYFELYGQTGDRYIATAGNFIDAHRTFLGAKEFPKQNFFVATDNDLAGEQFYKQIKEIIPTAQRLRSYSKDFNQDLKDCKNGDLSEYLMTNYSSPSALSDLDIAFEAALDLDDFTTTRKKDNDFEAEEEEELAIPF